MLRRFLISLLALSPLSLQAADGCTDASGNCVEVGKWRVSVALGAGVRTNPVMSNKDIPLIVLPEIQYQGERFFIQNLDFGAMLWENEGQQLNLLVTPGYDQVFFHRWSLGNFIVDSRVMMSSTDKSALLPEYDYRAAKSVDMSRLHKRRMAALGGIEYQVVLDKWSFQWQWLHDLIGVHDGQELRLAMTRSFRTGKHHTALTAGANWQSDEITDYYFGVRENEVNSLDDTWKAGSGVSYLLRADWNYQLNDKWTLRATGSYTRLPSAIRNSPIVTSDYTTTVFVGGVYHF